MEKEFLCIGEILWDSMPSGLFLGGAPYNVAWHLHALGQRVNIVSRIGDDTLGKEAIRRIKAIGLTTDLIQLDPKLRTGFVEVTLDQTGNPEYEIVEPVAWDRIMLNEENEKKIKSVQVVVYGTLAQRSEISRKTIQALAHTTALKVLDLNLRAPYYNPDIVKSTLVYTDLLKMNQSELNLLKNWFELPTDDRDAIFALKNKFQLKSVCVTQGGRGAILWHENNWYINRGYNVNVIDTVGSGDAFLAAFLAGYLNNMPPDKVLDISNRLGAYTATHNGSTPAYSLDTLLDVYSLPLDSNVINDITES